MKKHHLWGRGALTALAIGLLGTGAFAQTAPKDRVPPSVFETINGRGVVQLDQETLSDMGVRVELRNQEGDATILPLALDPNQRIELLSLDRTFATFAGGTTTFAGRADFIGPNDDRVVIRNPEVWIDETQGGTSWTLSADGVEALHFVSPNLVELDGANGRMSWGDVEVLLAADLAHQLGVTEGAGTVIGSLRLEAAVAVTGRTGLWEDVEEHPAGGSASRGGIGPDVIVGDLPNTSNWGAVGNIRAYSVGTTSCNIGDENLDWFANNNMHPVIGQSLYRLKDGKFEHIGQSWLKHGFFALSGSLCFNDCQGTSGQQLGVHCSDPYSSGLNGNRGDLGPKSQVNASTGHFPYPPTRPSTGNSINGRLQVKIPDVDPAQNSGALYFVEGHYITPDDAAAGNDLNNASWRRVNITGGNFNLSLTGSTVREQAAIQAWGANESGVTYSNVDVPNDGRFIVASKATNIGGNIWNYEYAVHNLNSDRSGRSFSVPIPLGANPTNIEFHDVDYHTGEPYSDTDWTVTMSNGMITWTTQSFSANQNANALRWGTLYNFRFDLERMPESGDATIGLFKPGSPTEMVATAQVPMQGDAPDLFIKLMQADYDPADGDIDAGPGVLEQAIDLYVVVTNPGNVPITQAEIGIETSVLGGTLIQRSQVVTDFSPDPGVQSLAPDGIATFQFSINAGELDRCGSYTTRAFHNPANMLSDGSDGQIAGDINSTNDELFDYPDTANNPADGITPDAVRIVFGTIDAQVSASSEIIENPATERVTVMIDFVGLGPGGDSHDVELIADLLELNGDVAYAGVFSVSRDDVRSSGMRMTAVRLRVNNLNPPPPPNAEYRVRLRLRDTNSNAFCISTETTNTTTIQ